MTSNQPQGQSEAYKRLSAQKTLAEILEVAISFEKTAHEFYAGLINKVSKNIRYLVEANDRKTMGDFIYSLYELFNNSSGGRGLYVENIQIRTFKDMRSFLGKNIYSPESKKGVIPCSPPGNLKTWLYEVE